MSTLILRGCPILKTKLGDDGMLELQSLLESQKQRWREDVLETAGDRFERRLVEEASRLRTEIGSSRADVIRWSFVFWITQLTAMGGMGAILVRAIGQP